MAMPIQAPPNERILVKIDEVDVAQRLVHAKDKMNANIQVSWRDTGGAVTSIPASGETWTARREGYIWYLENRLDDEEAQAFTEMLSPGDAVVSAKGDLYLRAETVVVNDETLPTQAELDDRYALVNVPNEDDSIHARRDAATDAAYQADVANDTHRRWTVQADGAMLWGDGTSEPDVKLYRAAADLLKTEDVLEFQRPLATNSAWWTRVGSNVNQSLVARADGKFEWGDGVGGFDTNLYRGAANQMKTDDSFVMDGSYVQVPRQTTAQRNALTPAVGYTIFNTDNHMAEVYDGLEWVPLQHIGASVIRTAWERTDCRGEPNSQSGGVTLHQEGAWFSVGVGTGAQVVRDPSETLHPGVWSLETGTTASGEQRLMTSDFAEGRYYFSTTIKTPVVSDATNAYIIVVGPGIAGTISAVRYTHSEDSGRWKYQGPGGASSDLLDDNGGAIQVAGSTWYTIEFFVNNGVGTIRINGVVKGSGITMTNNFESNAGVRIIKSAGTANRGLRVDQISLYRELPNYRW